MTRFNKNQHLKSIKAIQGVTTMTNRKLSVKELNQKTLINEMSKSSHELFNDTFNRVSEITGSSVTSVKKYWSELRHEIPAIFSKYPNLTREEKEILLTKSTAFERKSVERTNSWNEEDVNKILRLIAKFYVPGKSKKEIYEQVSNELGKTAKAIELVWYNKLRHTYTTADITPQEKGIISKFAQRSYPSKKIERQTLVNKSHIREINKQLWEEKETEGSKLGKPTKLRPSEFRSNRFRNQNVNDVLNEFIEEQTETREIKPEEIACPEFLKQFNIKPSKPEVKELPENSFEDSEYIIRKVSEDEYEVLKGVVKINKEDVNKFLNNNKTVVLDSDNKMIAKNYL